jgi:hypothetical protein
MLVYNQKIYFFYNKMIHMRIIILCFKLRSVAIEVLHCVIFMTHELPHREQIEKRKEV